jgi:hypothetical protein
MKAPSRKRGPRKLRAALLAPAVLAELFPKVGPAPFSLRLPGHIKVLIMLIFIIYFKSLANIYTLIYHMITAHGSGHLT